MSQSSTAQPRVVMVEFSFPDHYLSVKYARVSGHWSYIVINRQYATVASAYHGTTEPTAADAERILFGRYAP